MVSHSGGCVSTRDDRGRWTRLTVQDLVVDGRLPGVGGDEVRGAYGAGDGIEAGPP